MRQVIGVLGLLLLAGGSVLAYLYMADAKREATTVEPPAGAGDTALVLRRLDELQVELALLRASVGRLDVADVVRPAPTTTRQPAMAGDPPTDTGTDAEALNAALARLENTFRLELEKTRELITESGAAGLVERIRSDRRHVDWAAWEDVIVVWKRDMDEARRMVKLMTADELIERYGPPTDVWTNTNGLTWQYARIDPLDATKLQEVILRLPDGYVAQLHYRETKAKD